MKKNIATVYLGIAIFALLFIFSAITVSAGIIAACNYHAYRDCAGSSVYWFNSCDNRQDLYQDCAGFGQTCQYGQCVLNYNPAPNPNPNPYIVHYKTGCYNNNLYWYDSLAAASDLYKSCQDTNSCTIDKCVDGKCSNALKCDGSTCAKESIDYCSSCQHIGDAACNCQENSVSAPNDCKVVDLSVSFFSKKDLSLREWEKNVQLAPNANIYFLAVIKNDTNAEVDNININANIPVEIAFLGNLKINDIPASGNIISGVNLGFLAPGAEKSITFEGKTQQFSVQGTKEAVIMVNAGPVAKIDSVALNFELIQAEAAISKTFSSFAIMEFLKRWYGWILAAIIPIFLFIVVFRRFSASV
ncbi:MAG: hypothetical protein CEN87_285 [Parcubacteria group bacterium Licking1014_1]|nr:MAG: hypothetical protein CEN87_285 [Parcubacteria group bacterium Licking1014_1]